MVFFGLSPSRFPQGLGCSWVWQSKWLRALRAQGHSELTVVLQSEAEERCVGQDYGGVSSAVLEWVGVTWGWKHGGINKK